MDWFLQHDIESSKPDAWFRLSVVLQVMLECRLLNDLNLIRNVYINPDKIFCIYNVSSELNSVIGLFVLNLDPVGQIIFVIYVNIRMTNRTIIFITFYNTIYLNKK